MGLSFENRARAESERRTGRSPFANSYIEAFTDGALWACEQLSDYSEDAEDCPACYEADAECLYHQGVIAGIDWMSQHLARIAADPEVLNMLAAKGAGE